MQETLEDLLTTYQTEFPQQVRDLAETFSVSTTRVVQAPRDAPPRLTNEFRLRAKEHGISEEDLAAAIAMYSRIEALAEANHRQKR